MEEVPYDVIAKYFKNRSVVPFLGAAASFTGADETIALPGGRGLARMFAQKSRYPGSLSDPLTKITQYVEEIPADRDFLLNEIESIFCTGLSADYSCSLTAFFRSLPIQYIPKLIATTNYDILVERVLEQRRLPYLAISNIMRNDHFANRFVAYRKLAQVNETECIFKQPQLEELLIHMEHEEPDTTLIYKIHGTARMNMQRTDGHHCSINSIVLTESDYIEFLEDNRLNKVPSRILKALRRSNLLFLGYSLEDWNFRVLLQRLQRVQQKHKERVKRHWACRLMEDPDPVERKFWEYRDVQLCDISLDVFLYELGQRIEGVTWP